MTIEHAPRASHEHVAETPAPPRWARATLAVAGGVAVMVGAALTIVPRSFIDLAGEPTADLLSETRAPGGSLVAVGVFIVVASARQRFLRASAVMAALTYLGYGLARGLGVIVDGRPSATIVSAMIIEVALGAASLAVAIACDDAPPVVTDADV